MLIQSLRDIPSLRTNTSFDFQTNIIIAEIYRASYKLFESPNRDTIRIVYNILRNLLKKRAKNFDITYGLQSDITSNQILYSTRYPIILMTRCQRKSTLTLYYVQSLYLNISRLSVKRLIHLS